MPNEFNDIGSRSENRTKRRKTNIILNTLIAIVLILILIVGGKIFLGETKTEQIENERLKTEQQNEKKIEETSQDAHQDNEESNPASEDESEMTDNEIVESDSDEENVEKVITNPAWKPIGTEQMNGHQSSYSKNTVDWNEKLQAAAYAIDTTVDGMTTWWVEGGDIPETEALLTVSAKGSSDVYRVHIEWVDTEGWKPTVVKKLIENDRKN